MKPLLGRRLLIRCETCVSSRLEGSSGAVILLRGNSGDSRADQPRRRSQAAHRIRNRSSGDQRPLLARRSESLGVAHGPQRDRRTLDSFPKFALASARAMPQCSRARSPPIWFRRWCKSMRAVLSSSWRYRMRRYSVLLAAFAAGVLITSVAVANPPVVQTRKDLPSTVSPKTNTNNAVQPAPAKPQADIAALESESADPTPNPPSRKCQDQMCSWTGSAWQCITLLDMKCSIPLEGDRCTMAVCPEE
jgi:hypothetical protein